MRVALVGGLVDAADDGDPVLDGQRRELGDEGAVEAFGRGEEALVHHRDGEDRVLGEDDELAALRLRLGHQAADRRQVGGLVLAGRELGDGTDDHGDLLGCSWYGRRGHAVHPSENDGIANDSD